MTRICFAVASPAHLHRIRAILTARLQGSKGAEEAPARWVVGALPDRFRCSETASAQRGNQPSRFTHTAVRKGTHRGAVPFGVCLGVSEFAKLGQRHPVKQSDARI